METQRLNLYWKEKNYGTRKLRISMQSVKRINPIVQSRQKQKGEFFCSRLHTFYKWANLPFCDRAVFYAEMQGYRYYT